MSMDESSSHRTFDFDAALIVDSDPDHGQVVRACLDGGTISRTVHITSNVDGALCRLGRSEIDLVFIDTALPLDGAQELIEATFRLPSSPLLIAMGLTSDSAATTFALAKTGVHAYLLKPLSRSQIAACLSHPKCGLDPVRQLLRPLVGRFGLKDIQAYIRRELVREALARAGGSRRSAARILGVTRPAVQKFLREVGLDG